MPWFYDSRTGSAAEEAGALGFLSNLGSKLGLGWHQYATQADMLAAIKANNWPAPNYNSTVANPVGKTVVGSVQAATGATAASTTSCLITLPVLGGCILTKTNVRAMAAGAGLVLFGAVGIVGLLILAAQAAQKTGAGHAAGGALETAGAAMAFVPGLEGAGLAVGATGAAARRAGSSSGARQSLDRRAAARANP
jgi:hypothetical protein